MKSNYLLTTTVVFASLIQAAVAAPAVITGFVADLGGIPHESPDITIQVRTFPGGRLITSAKADKNSGYFQIPIDPEKVPDNNTRISVSAAGTAVLNGRRTSVRTDGSLNGLAGEIRSRFSDDIGVRELPVQQFIILIVPKAQEQQVSVKCTCKRSFRIRHRFRR